ncbi:hypothetical protein D3C72_2556380 [compost metagenome]
MFGLLGHDFVIEQRHIAQLAAGFQALVEGQHGFQVAGLGADADLALTCIGGQGQ